MSDNGNTGHRNTGDWNTGDRNTGNLNTGNRNTGHRNSGHWNTGNWNTGDLNTGHRNSGFFCTKTPSPTFFDKPFAGTWEEARQLLPFIELSVGAKWTDEHDMTDRQKAAFPNYETIGGCLEPISLTIQEAFPLAWAKMDAATKQRFLDLPNFDAEKFLACTGVDVRKPDAVANDAPADEIVLNGVRYRRVDAARGEKA